MVLAGLLLGIVTGLFFGEPAGSLRFIGDAYIGLLQMSVLPYVFVSLVTGLGRLNPKMAIKILSRTVLGVAALWLLIILSTVLVPLGYPDWDSASFFSASLIEAREPVDFLRIYIPSNPFNSFANGIVPAIVLFSIALGAALMGVPGKDTLLDPLDKLGEAVLRISRFVVYFSPIGVFAITASAAGTIRVDEFDRLQVYFFTSLVMWGLLTFWTLPMFIASRSPITYRSIFRQSRSALLTAFATGSLLVVLPLLADAIKRILEEHRVDNEEPIAAVDIIVPATYSVPSGGLFLSVAFVVFAAWATGASLGPAQVSSLSAVGTFTAFSGPNVAIPYLLDLFRLPADMFQLYLASDGLLGRLWILFSALFIVIITLLVTLSMEGRFRWMPRVPFVYLAPTVTITLAAIFLCGEVLERTIDHEYGQYEAFINRDLLTEEVATVQLSEDPSPLSVNERQGPRLNVIRERGSLRVGYLPDSLPYAFRNTAGELVGLDIELANVLAKDLGVSLELVRTKWDDIAPWLNSGQIDIVMSGLLVSPKLAQDVQFSASYLSETGAFVVPDHQRHQFSEYDRVLALGSQRFGYPLRGLYKEWVNELFPDFDVVTMSSPRPYFSNEDPDLDGLVYSAERGSAWTLLYPDYSVVIPEPLREIGPLAYALPAAQYAFLSYVNSWLAYAAPNRIPKLFAYWVQGENPPNRDPRWSIQRNVLNWTE